MGGKLLNMLLLMGVVSVAGGGVVSATARAVHNAAARAPSLQRYVHRADPAYRYEIRSRKQYGTLTVYTIRLVSQTWEGITWKHWLRLIVPADLKHRHKAILVITGGSNREPPTSNPPLMKAISPMVSRLKAMVAVLSQVPDEPLFHGLGEDDLIAYTFRRYLDGGNAQWPLLFPMVNSAVRAMDAVQAIARAQLHCGVQHFIVTGASKRGWTTWLTAAADRRVSAIAPMVIDMLSLHAQMTQQLKTYGHYSRQIAPYVRTHVIQDFGTPRGKQLVKAIDPFRYRAVLTMPKLIFSGTNDPYWTVDADSLYFPHLKGVKRLDYVANAGHGLSLNILPTLEAFFRAELNDQPLPKLVWHKRKDGALVVRWKRAGAAATLWQATSATRDFRHAHWTSTLLSGEKQVVVKFHAPSSGYLAYYVAVQFPRPLPFHFTTTMQVLPKRFPYGDHGKPRTRH